MITYRHLTERRAHPLRLGRFESSFSLYSNRFLVPKLFLATLFCLLVGARLASAQSSTGVHAPVAPTSAAPAPLTKGPKFSESRPDLRPGSGGSVGTPAALAAPVASQPGSTNRLTSLDDKYRLAIGDRLSFRIVEDEEDVKPLTVTDSGELEVPFLGRFPAVGKSCFELARALKAELEVEYYYQATVVVAVDSMTKSRGKVYLVGPVRAPGPQDIPSDEVLTLSKAILRAGGFTEFADKRKVKVTRKGSGQQTSDQTFTVNVEEILERGKMEADLPLQPGDLVYIQERLFRF